MTNLLSKKLICIKKPFHLIMSSKKLKLIVIMNVLNIWVTPIARFFVILNPYNFVPLTAHLKLKIYYSNELEHRSRQEVSLMTLNDKFTIQEINLDKKNLSYDNKLKEIEDFWNKECVEHPSNNHCKIFCDWNFNF